MDYENISLEMDEDVAVLTINRSQVRNALDPATWAEIRAAIRQCRDDSLVRVVVITGAGEKAFASGADIRSLRDRQALDVLRGEAQETLSDIEALDKVVIAAIDGFALGGGASWPWPAISELLLSAPGWDNRR